MARKKRTYRAKVKGCYECSQRRIDCDGVRPTCRKCQRDDLSCSGYGVRYRFNNGRASNGKRAKRSCDAVSKSPSVNLIAARPTDNTILTPMRDEQADILHTEEKQPTQESPPYIGLSTNLFAASDAIDQLSVAWDAHCDAQSPSLQYSHIEGSTIQLTADAAFDQGDMAPQCLLYADSRALLSTSSSCLLYEPSPDNLSSWERILFLNFSDYIANDMIAIDGSHNGWRHLILPLAQTDSLVRNAVLAVSALHVSFNNQLATTFLLHYLDPHILYANTLKGLQERCDLQSRHFSERSSVILAILLLMTANMVTGSSGFPDTFRTLLSALQAIGGEESLGSDDMARFLIRQIRKIRIYAYPFFSEESGWEVLSSAVCRAQVFDCLDYCMQQRPEHAATGSLIRDLIQQACDIYIGHTSRNPAPDSFCFSRRRTVVDMIASVEHFKITFEALPADCPGKQVLIWPCYIVASAAILEEHKVFFKGLLTNYHARSGFNNIAQGLQNLQKIWSRNPWDRWTALLPEAEVFVM